MRRKQPLLRKSSARKVALALGPVVGVLVGVLTNLITTKWNWWLFIGLVLLVSAAVALVVWTEGHGDSEKDASRDSAATPSGSLVTEPPAGAQGRRPSMVPPRSGRFVDRPDLIATLIQTVVTHPAGGGPVALVGTGGFGKTTIAEELCRRPEIVERFPDGDLWVTIGQLTSDAALTSKINDLSYVLSGVQPTISDPNLAGFHLGELLSNSAKLMVIDDVWNYAHLHPFLLGGPNCLRLVTTRNRSALPEDAVVVSVDAMERAEARQLLLSGLGDVPQQQVDRVLGLTGRWAVLLGLVNGAARAYADGGESASDALDRVARQLVEGGPETFDIGSLDDRRRAVAASVQASVRLLQPDEEKRYAELAVFPEDVEIPASVLARYWQAGGGLDEIAVDRLCRRLADLSLVMYHRQSPSRIRLHDVIWSYLRRQARPVLSAMNNTLLGAVEKTLPAGQQAGEAVPWWLMSADEEYLWDWLGHHLHEAGRDDELQTLVHDLRYLVRKIQLRGPVAAEADLALAADPLSEAIRDVVSQNGHLFERGDFEGGVAPTLINRLETVPGTAGIVADFVRTTGTSYLRNRWVPPDMPDPALRRVMAGHAGALYACTVEPNGTWLASGGADGDVHVWAGESGRLLRVIHAHDGTVWRCAASPDGAWLATVGNDGWVRTWDAESGEQRAGRKISANPVFACAVSPNGTWIATSGDGPVRVWDAGTLEFLRTLEGDAEPFWGGCAFSADGSTLAAGGSDGAVRVWTVATGSLRHVLTHPTAAWDCAVYPDGRQLAAARSEGLILIWDLETGQIVRELRGHVGPVQAVELSADGTWLISTGADRTVRIWDAKTGELRKVLEGHTEQVWECALPAHGSWFATAAADATVRIWALPSAALDGPAHERRPTWPVWACAAPGSGQWLANSSDDGTVRIWELPSGRQWRFLPEQVGPIWACAAPDDGSWLAVAGGDGSALIWDTETAATRHLLTGHDGPIWACAAPGGGEWLATAGEDRLIRIWDVSDGTVRHVIEGHPGPVWAVATSRSGDWLATAGADGALNLWNASDGKLRRLVDQRQEAVLACAALNGGAWLAAAGADGAVRIWDVGDGRLLLTLAGHAGPVWACAASPSGEWLATTGRDRTVRVWRPGRSEECVTGIRLGSYGRACCWVGGDLDLCVGADAGTYLFSLMTEQR